jgi:hypothetical protein
MSDDVNKHTFYVVACLKFLAKVSELLNVQQLWVFHVSCADMIPELSLFPHLFLNYLWASDLFLAGSSEANTNK